MAKVFNSIEELQKFLSSIISPNSIKKSFDSAGKRILKKIDTNSLYFKLNLIIFIVITLGTVLQTAYHVLDIKNSVSKQILQQSKVNLFEIKESIMPFVDSYEVSEYENILKSYLRYISFYDINYCA